MSMFPWGPALCYINTIPKMLRVSFEKPLTRRERLLLTIMERESRRVAIMSSVIAVREKEQFVEFNLCGMVSENELFRINLQFGAQ